MSWRRRLRHAREGARLVGAVAAERLGTGQVFNPFTDRARRDPYALYRRLRERDPVHRSRPARGWILFRHADCLAVLRDPRLSADDRHQATWARDRARAVADGLVAADEPVEPVMLRSDPPRHTRLRGLVSQAFTPRAVESWRGRAEEVTAERLDGLAGRSRFDVIAELAVPLPVTLIAEMLGVPAADHPVFKRWSDDLVGFLDPWASPGPARLRRTVEEFEAYMRGRIEARRREPREDILSALVQAEEAGERLSPRELLGTLALLLAAGNETTTNLIGNGLLALLRHPDAWERLCAEPERAGPAVEELLRWDSPVQLTMRIPTEPVELRGQRLLPGQLVVAVLGSANRDPEVFADPDRLDLDRPERERRHLAFGHGIHFCLGAQLARLEAQVALAALARRLPELRLDGGEPRWRRLSFLRGLEALPVRTGAQAAMRAATSSTRRRISGSNRS